MERLISLLDSLVARKSSVFILLSLLPSALVAQTIGVKDAQNKALQFLQSQPKTRASQQEVQLSLAYTSQVGDETYYYVFNNTSGGYVIMGGDEAAHEVLGYSDKGTFDYARIPDNMRWWLSQYDAQISQAIREVKAGENKVARQAKTRAERTEVPVMLTTSWEQGIPYNMQLPPNLNGEQSGKFAYITGCAVTAAAQVMNYFRWPETGIGSKTQADTFTGHTFTADFEHTHYDWEAMRDTYDTIYTGTREEVAVGTLMYHLGVAFDAAYFPDGTDVRNIIMPLYLEEYFRYNKGMAYLSRYYYNDDEWEEMVYEELSAGRPVIYAGLYKSLGHSFVCDGYKEGRWHINWGLDRRYNDYFLLTPTRTEEALRPDSTGTGGSVLNMSFSSNQNIIIGICPDPDGSSQYKKHLFFSSAQLDNNLCSNGDSIKLKVTYTSFEMRDETFEVRYELVNANNPDESFPFGDTCSFTLATPNLNSYYLVKEHSLTISSCIPDGVKKGADYLIIPFYKDEEGEWQQVRGQISPGPIKLRIINEIEITEQLSVESQGNACKESFGVSFAIKNFSDKTLSRSMVIRVYPTNEKDAAPVDYFDLGEITLAPGEERQIHVGAEDLHFGDRMVIGEKYFVQLEDCAEGKALGDASLLNFLNTLSISFTVPEMGWTTLAVPFDVEIPDGLKAYSVFFESLDSISIKKRDNLMKDGTYLIHGDPGTYQVVGPALDFPSASISILHIATPGIPLKEGNAYILDQRDGIVGFYRIQEPTEIGKYEAYLIDLFSKEMLPIHDPDEENPTSLSGIMTLDADASSKTYNLFGNEVSEDFRGIMICKGKKIIKF